jgi:hypothetical protein
MTLREHDHGRREAGPRTGTPPGYFDLRGDADRLLARGADAIDRALSQDSTAWLAANRQEGGQ